MIFYAAVFARCILMCLSSYKFAADAGTTEAASTLWQTSILATFNTSFELQGLYVNFLMLLCFIIAWILIYLCIKDGAKQV
ncbi:hypothetical protein IJU97_00875 [bacterium]|nr:hypothetical protein [bacterium]